MGTAQSKTLVREWTILFCNDDEDEHNLRKIETDKYANSQEKNSWGCSTASDGGGDDDDDDCDDDDDNKDHLNITM